jgi:CheY-like chemotaxis protein
VKFIDTSAFSGIGLAPEQLVLYRSLILDARARSQEVVPLRLDQSTGVFPTTVAPNATPRKQGLTAMTKRSVIKGSPSIAATAPIDNTKTLLSISPIELDHLSLEAIIGHSRFRLFQAGDITSALILLQKHDFAVVLCERDLLPGTWIDLLDHITALPIPPSLIVTSRLADERLWAEALNLGAWDVLVSQPFIPSEVIRTVESAWRHWDNQIQIRATGMRKLTAAS